MLRILVGQLLPLLLALLGAILGVTMGAFMGPKLTRNSCIVIVALVTAVVAFALYLICDAYRLERRVKELGATIRVEIDRASDIEYRARDGKLNIQSLVNELEAWRNRVDVFLRTELPESGADIRFRTGGGPVGSGPELYEYVRLTTLRSNLLSVLDNLPSYVQRSH